MQKLKNKKVYAFIDSQNLNLGILSQGWKLDFYRFLVYLKDKYQVSKAFIFIGYLPDNKPLYTYLEKAGYILIFKPILEVEKNKKTIVKGNVDAELVLHSMIEYPNYDKAIIVSSDGDFHCLIEYLKNKNKLERVLIPNRRKYSKLLWEFRKEIDYLNNLESKLEKGHKKRGVALRTKP